MNDLATHLRNAATDWDGLPGHEDEEIIHYITCKKAREIADHIEAQNKLIQEMREAFEQYEAALRNRQHGVVAMGRLAADIGFIYSKSTPNTPERNDK